MKKIIATIMTLALVLGLCSATAFAADDIVLDGDGGSSSFIGEYSGSGKDYKYLGFATSKNATAEYKYLQLTYTGDISMFRIECHIPPADSTDNDGPYWFVNSQVMHFVTADGSAIPTKVDSPTTIVIDLAATGIDMSKYDGFHLHYLNPDAQSGSFSITDARLMTSATSAGNSNTPAPAPAETKAPSTNAAKTGSTSVPTVAALLVVVCAGAVLVYSKKRA